MSSYLEPDCGRIHFQAHSGCWQNYFFVVVGLLDTACSSLPHGLSLRGCFLHQALRECPLSESTSKHRNLR